ncbi:hypothetical protein CONLIGDRAFT_141874 [Coniochaeta ligniaria NRRL 30616]|uniref:Uncharacterized protein n=1 Tax=Coniochaeta ligniaria NRRL 30616 TaxID=1408157 RepID=A0A1J7IQ65_9PEZI|nr:hypothetical protein CONLIGDRAFT_141874 [Coniochaeta ligniaria NRRL 30616]
MRTRMSSCIFLVPSTTRGPLVSLRAYIPIELHPTSRSSYPSTGSHGLASQVMTRSQQCSRGNTYHRAQAKPTHQLSVRPLRVSDMAFAGKPSNVTTIDFVLPGLVFPLVSQCSPLRAHITT